MAIKYAHTELGFPSPTDDAQVKQVFRGIKRQYGTAAASNLLAVRNRPRQFEVLRCSLPGFNGLNVEG